jgi:cation diffusion facilitator family transporter
MVTLLVKLCIKKYRETSNPAVRLAYGMLCGAVGIGLNLLLFAGKCIAGTLAGSIAVTADAFNNLSDAGSSLVTLIGFRLAGQKPDHEHPFGHGRFEYISGLIVSMAILLMGLELLRSSVEKIMTPEQVEFRWLVVVILAVSILVKLYMALYNARIGKKIESAAMRATATDSLSDCIATAVVLLSMFIGKWTNLMIDGWCGLAVAVFILIAGVRAAKETIGPLLGQPPAPEFVKRIEQIVLSHSLVVGIHDLVVHDYGPGRCMITLHTEVPESGNFTEMHDVIDNIEHDLRNELGCEATIHMDPIATDDVLTNETHNKIAELVKVIDERITIHDFRMVAGPTHTNVIFDVVVPYKFRLTDEEVLRDVQRLVRSLDGNYFAVVQIDKSYTD